MTRPSKALLGLCAALLATVIYLTRDEVTNAGPRNLQTRIHNRWTGSVTICAAYGEPACKQVYPPAPGG